MNAIIRAVTKPDVPPRAVDRGLARVTAATKRLIARIQGAKRLPTPAQMQALRDKHPPKHAKKKP